MRILLIIPVYNAFLESVACLRSVLAHTPADVNILVIDDASPDGEFLDYIPARCKGDDRLIVKRFEENQGYVKAVNFGMRLGEHVRAVKDYYVHPGLEPEGEVQSDIILLNSDTLVTPRWVEKLQRAAYSDDAIGTVTPYSNNAVIASFPRFCVPHEISVSDIVSLAENVERLSACIYPELPTAMGFCNYIRRNVVSDVGFYNEKDFGRGNGEENDFSMRVKAKGYKNILDDATYIYHVGEASFADTKKALEQEHGKVICKLYPHYMDMISKFCSLDPHKHIRNTLLDKLMLENESAQRVLHIVHNGPFVKRGELLGGTELHVQDIIVALDSCMHWSLTPHGGCYYLTAYFANVEREFILDKQEVSLEDLLSPQFFSVIHVHHMFGFERESLVRALHIHGNYLYSVHDFNSVCPRNSFITPAKRVCNTKECSSACGFSSQYMDTWRRLGADVLQRAKHVICFSKSSEKILIDVLGKDTGKTTILRHSVPLPKTQMPIRSIEGEIHVLLLGVLAPHKGFELIKELVATTFGSVKVTFHLLGSVYEGKKIKDLVLHGSYKRNELYEKVHAINPHLVFISSICPETYSLTLDEAFACGLPAIVGGRGAAAERVRNFSAGWVVDDLSSTKVKELLCHIAENKDEYLAACKAARSAPLLSIAEEASCYQQLYDSLFVNQNAVELKSILSFLTAVELARPQEKNKGIRALGHLSNLVIKYLDKIGLRPFVQKLIFKFFPKSVLYRIKAARV